MKTSALEIDRFLLDPNTLPSPPGIVLQILGMLDDEEVGISEISTVIEKDISLSTKFIQMSNSSLFGQGKEVTNIQRALMVIGLRSARMVALSSSMKSIFPATTGMAASSEIRMRSALNAVSTRMFMERSRSMWADEGFLAGLFTHVGPVILASQDPDIYAKVVDENGYVDNHKLVSELGFSADTLTGRLISSWGIPPVIGSAITNRYDPDQAFGTTPEEDIAKGLTFGLLMERVLSGSGSPEVYETLVGFAESHLSTTEEEVYKLVSEIEEAVKGFSSVFDFALPSEHSYTDMMISAANQMEKLSLSTISALDISDATVRSLQERNELLQSTMNIDSLTGLLNRRAFEEILDAELDTASKYGSDYTLGLALFDIDDFKEVNDTYGHLVGDEVLKRVGATMSISARKSEFFARYGGEEFALIMPGIGPDDVKLAAERIRRTIESEVIAFSDISLTVTVSVGGAILDLSKENPRHDLINSADKNLYEAKASGRNKVVASQ